MNKPKISVFDTIGFGLIIEYPTGVLVSNQTGGIMCNHPEIEGIYIPLCNDSDGVSLISPENELSRYFDSARYGKMSGLDRDDVAFISKVLQKYHLDTMLKVDESRLQESHEAWIFVEVDSQARHSVLEGFSEKLKGVITWCNSD